MKTEMFNDQGMFIERDVHMQLFDHSQELLAVEVITKESFAIVARFVNNYKSVSRKNSDNQRKLRSVM